MGLGSLRNLITYYQSSIIDYKNKKLSEVNNDIRTCDNTIEKIKEEQRQVNGRSIMYVNYYFLNLLRFFCSLYFEIGEISRVEEDNSAIPELHVTSMLGNELLSSSFETGLQMLHTIENQK